MKTERGKGWKKYQMIIISLEGEEEGDGGEEGGEGTEEGEINDGGSTHILMKTQV